MKREYVEIDVGQVTTKHALRRGVGDMATLESSIRTLGLLQPILVDKNNALIAGARRLQACRNVGLTVIPAFRLDIEATSLAGLDIQADENLCREPMTNDELERHIQSKKALIEAQGQPAGVMGRIRRFFSGSSAENGVETGKD